MKRLLAIALVICMLLMIVACNGNQGGAETTEAPTSAPTEAPTSEPTEAPTSEPTEAPTSEPTEAPTDEPTEAPTDEPTEAPTSEPTEAPTSEPTEAPTDEPTEAPTSEPTEAPTDEPTEAPTDEPTEAPTDEPTEEPTEEETEPELSKAADDARADMDYYMAASHEKVGKVMYLCGKNDGFYPLSTFRAREAVKVRLEATTGGYYLYFVTNAAKTYINVSKISSFTAISFDAEAKTVFEYDKELKTLKTKIGEVYYFIGAYDDFTFFSASELKWAEESYVAHLYETECDHVYIADSEGHSLLACAKCGQSAGEKEAHDATLSVKREKGKKTYYCATCDYVVSIEECDGNHYVGDKDGHREAACDICGTADGEKKAHSDVVTEMITDNAYTAACDVCGYAYYSQSLDNIVSIITANMWGKTATTYYQLNNGRSYGSFTFEEGSFPYGTITGSNKVGQILFNRSRNDTTAGSDGQQYHINAGDAKYLLIKIRTNNNAQSVSFAFSSTGKNGIKSVNLPISSLENNKWSVIAINLAATFGEYYVRDASTGKYVVDSFYFTMNDFASTTSLDIAYMAFIEGAGEEIGEFTGENELLVLSGTTTAWTEVAEIGNSTNHTYVMQVLGGYYVGVCSDCGDRKSYGVRAESANYFISPDYISSNAGAQGTHSKTLMTEDEVNFVRIDNFKAPGGWGGVNVLNKDVGVTGQYMVIKLRIGENGGGQTTFKMFCSTKANALTEDAGFSVKVSEDNEWHVIVIDLSARIKSPSTHFVADGDGYHTRYLQLRPFSNFQTTADATDYMDIAYIAFCDSLRDIPGIVSDETYELSVSSTSSETYYTNGDGGCAVHSPAAMEKSENADGSVVYSVACSVCEKSIYEKKVPASVTKYYSGSDIVTGAPHYYLGNKGEVGFDNDAGVAYGKEGANRQIIWHRAQIDCSSSTRSSQLTTADIGNANYFVIKLKASNLARTLNVTYSTSGKNSDTAVATSANPSGFDITGKKGIEIGDTYATNSGYTTITLPIASVAKAGEWVTFVVDLNAVVGEYHKKTDGADSYVMDTLLFDIVGDGSISFEYMAFIEGGEAELSEFVGDGEVYSITNKSGAYEKLSLAD